MGFSSIQLSDFPSTKIKIDQFFMDWLALEGEEVVTVLASKISTGDDGFKQDVDFALQAPPRSPPPNRKSPKKRTQSEMLSNLMTVHQIHILGPDWALEIKPVRPK